MYLTDAFSIFRLMKIRGIGPARIRSILNGLQNNNLFDDFSQNNLYSSLKPDEILSLEKSETLDGEEWSRLKDLGAKYLTQWDEHYPLRLHRILGNQTPPILFILGNPDLFQTNSIGFCGSRKASEKGLKTAQDITEQLVEKKFNIVSGYATGVDVMAHKTALENGGTTTIVLSEGIFHFRIKKEFKDVWDWSRVLVVSEFLPSRPWNVGNAMQRNSTILALSDCMVLIEARSTGGSMEAGKKALSMNIPLFAPVYDGMPESALGNFEILQKGAYPITRSSQTGKANINPIMDLIRKNNNRVDITQDKSA